MKKIINGKLYDTEKADLIMGFRRKAQAKNLFGEFEIWAESELYRTKKGSWFEVVGTDLRESRMNALSEDQAKEIIKVDADKYLEIYGDVEEA